MVGLKKLLITGASGFLGQNICQVARDRWNIFGTAFSSNIEVAGIKTIRIDLRDFKELKRMFQEIRPDAVIHAAAITDSNYCQRNRQETHKINVEVSINIAGLCADHGIPCVFTSTDLVFDGLKPPYREEDPVSPINFYGEQKVMAEEGMLNRHSLVTICRLPLMFGLPGSFIQPIITAMKKGQELKLFTDEFRTPVSGRVAAQGLLMMLEKETGVIHLGGPERISRYDFGRLLRDVLGLHEARLQPCKQKDVPMAAPRAPDVSLDSSKAFALGFRPSSLREELNRIKEDLYYTQNDK